MRVAPGLHIVASGAFGFDLTDRFDCTVWLIDSGPGGAVLFDTGSGLDCDGLLRIAEADGIDASAIRTVVCTHAHADHSGGLGPLVSRLGLRVVAGAATAALLAAGDEEGISLGAARRAGIYPSDYVWQPAPVDQVVADGETIGIGRLRLRAIATPGHSGDHVAWLVEEGDRRMLISGDAVFHGGRVVLQNIYDCSVTETCASIRRLAALQFESLLPAHGLFSLRDGSRHLTQALKSIDGLLPPPSLFG